ncbi:MAG TPA: DUF2934 domain-containing protein [Gammaproteobacteria bacterium]|nr:DUF2934 domain-containing protein [Gammaproteobacteria bacterium]
MARTPDTSRASNTAGTPGGARSGGRAAATPRGAIPADERRRQIAEAAYYRAEKRGFQGGDPVDDWLVAEAEFNRAGGRRARAKR